MNMFAYLQLSIAVLVLLLISQITIQLVVQQDRKRVFVVGIRQELNKACLLPNPLRNIPLGFGRQCRSATIGRTDSIVD